ncbi:hypothetical protein [Noviherbaspirillum pedocola]|uniref:Uncharacterized protein n=1 Tax=Noviherbaspirillum pedocola TaxID=2801341 RepID=A0A934SUV0_9BURK|nr:hypothetical protein [Noviherbaspirillum pedocola]MBK4736147.1 hypothetical protein [Noviherbaspirillum pedocola]
MTYLFALTLCQFAAATFFIQATLRSTMQIAAADWRVQCVLMSGLLFAATFVSSLYPPVEWVNGKSVNVTPLLALVAGAVGLCVFGPIAYLMGRGKRLDATAHLTFGFLVLASVSAAYVVYAAADDLMFWRGKGSGVMSAMVFERAGVQCESGYVFVRREGAAYRYRCPTSIVAGHPFGEPFAPWPAYREGRSEALGTALDSLLQEAHGKQGEGVLR